MLYNISNGLRIALRVDGYAKVASEVMRAQNEYVDGVDTIGGAVRSLAMKVAVNRENERIVVDGLLSLRRMKGL
jgi:hypothetical protein